MKSPCKRNNFWKRFKISRLPAVKLLCKRNDFSKRSEISNRFEFTLDPCKRALSHTTLWTRDHERSHDKLKTSSLPQGLWPLNLAAWLHTRRSVLHKVADPLMTWSCNITWQMKYVIPLLPQMLIAIKLGKVVSYYKGLPCIKSHNPLNTWSFEIT